MKKYIAALWLAVTFIPSLLAFAGEKNSKCLEYEPEIITLTGVLLEQVFPGRPEHASIQSGDELLTHWILQLKEPICVNGKDDDLVNEEAHGVCAIQLTHTSKHMPDMYKRYERLLSKEIVVTGTLFHSISAWHKKRILIEVKDIKTGETEGGDFNNCSEIVAVNPSGLNENNVKIIIPQEKIKNIKSHKKYTKVESGMVDGERTIKYTGPGVKDVYKIGGSRAWRNNNPFNFRCGKFAMNHGALGCDGIFAIFSDKKIGENAYDALFKLSPYSDMTIEELTERWAPSPYKYSANGANLKKDSKQ